MKKLLVVVFVCLLATLAVAAEKNISIVNNTTFNGKAIAPGSYKLSYEIKGSTAEMKIMKSNQVVATATGQVVEQKDRAPYTAVVNQTNPDGSNTVVEIQIANQKQVIRLNAEAGAAGK